MSDISSKPARIFLQGCSLNKIVTVVLNITALNKVFDIVFLRFLFWNCLLPTSSYYSTARSLGHHLIKVRVPYLEQSRFSVQTDDEEPNTSEAESLKLIFIDLPWHLALRY